MVLVEGRTDKEGGKWEALRIEKTFCHNLLWSKARVD